MDKPRIGQSKLAAMTGNRNRWQCRGGPFKHGEYITGYGDTPDEAWKEFYGRMCDRLSAEKPMTRWERAIWRLMRVLDR